MKKIIILMSIFTLFSCNNKRNYPNDSNFIKLESKFSIKSGIADKIYDENFEEIFQIKKDSNFATYYNKIVYIQKNAYYIGYASTLDKRGSQNPSVEYLAKIDSETGEISVVKK